MSKRLRKKKEVIIAIITHKGIYYGGGIIETNLNQLKHDLDKYIRDSYEEFYEFYRNTDPERGYYPSLSYKGLGEKFGTVRPIGQNLKYFYSFRSDRYLYEFLFSLGMKITREDDHGSFVGVIQRNEFKSLGAKPEPPHKYQGIYE